jgi:hypothetical protein
MQDALTDETSTRQEYRYTANPAIRDRIATSGQGGETKVPGLLECCTESMGIEGCKQKVTSLRKQFLTAKTRQRKCKSSVECVVNISGIEKVRETAQQSDLKLTTQTMCRSSVVWWFASLAIEGCRSEVGLQGHAAWLSRVGSHKDQPMAASKRMLISNFQ